MEGALKLLAIVMLVSSFAEAVVCLSLRVPYDVRAALASLVTFIGRGVLNQVLPIAVAMPGAGAVYELRWFEPERWGWLSYPALFGVVEVLYYGWHRLSHRCRWLWVSHAVHHTSNEVNFASAYRLGWTSQLMGGYAIFVPACLLGFEPEKVLGAYGLLLTYQFWLHVDWIPRLGPLEGIINTPLAHRVHHAANAIYLDCNYGGVLMLLDRLFGTYRSQMTGEPCRYGLTEPLRSHNPLRINFHQFGPLLRDLRRARSLGVLLGYLFGAPGWQPRKLAPSLSK